MSSKHEMAGFDPQNVPNAPPDYNNATAPQAAYPNLQGMGTGAIQQQPIVVMQNPPRTNLGPRPTMAQCPSCHGQYMSKVEYENSMKTHLFAIILLVTTCCCCIPYCIDSCKNANHHCSNCGAYLGTYNN